MSTEEFKRKVAVCSPSFDVLSEYNGLREKVLRKCTVCGDTRSVSARMLLEGRKCIVCAAKERAKSKRKCHDQFLLEIASINSNIHILSEYTTNNSLVKCKCLIDEFEWETYPHILLQGHGCPECGRRNNDIASKKRMTHEEFVGIVTKKFKNVKIMSQYTNMSTPVRFNCQVCNYDWTGFPQVMLKNSSLGCPRCSGKAMIDISEFIKRLSVQNPYVAYHSGYSMLSRHAKFECVKCGHTWDALPYNILKGRCCPKCNLSNGAKRIEQYFKNHNIIYESEKRFESCKDERPLPFDFYIPSNNTAIEYDGEQHFEPVKFGECSMETAIAKYNKVQAHDKIKNQFCIDNNITLVRIPYTRFDEIENILDKHFS